MRTEFVNARTLEGGPFEFVVDGDRFGSPGPVGATVDLAGATVLPGFVDAHCHILPTGLDALKLHLGPCRSREEVLDAVRDRHAAQPEGWLLAVHYDQTRFPDARHLTRQELDSVVPGRPALLRHSNGHASVANSAALAAAGVNRDTPDPTGGAYVRDEGGEPNGVLLERAHEHVSAQAPTPTFDDMVQAILLAGESMSRLGITCATDMMTGRWDLERELLAYAEAARRGCKVRLRTCLQWGTVLGPRGIDPGRLRDLTEGPDPSRCRPIGLKIFADGAIGSATAAIYGKYLTTDGDGQLIYSPERLKEMVRLGDEAGWAIAIHTIGDRSTDLVMDAYDATADPTRHRIEHAMVLSDAQIERMSRQGARVTMQPEFLLRFGHAYAKQLPPEVARRIKRVRSVLAAGLRLSFSSDRPIVPGDPWEGIKAAVSRPEGFDPAENVDLASAVRLYTSAGAEANGDGGTMGELTPGAFADFQVYTGAPGSAGPAEVWLGGQRV